MEQPLEPPLRDCHEERALTGAMPIVRKEPILPPRMNLLTLASVAALAASASVVKAEPVHNVVLYVADGLRSGIVRPDTAPAMAQIRRVGVDFRNSHALFPTFTTANASAMATGHYLGDTGDFSNTIYAGFPVPGAGASVTPFLENDPVLGDVDAHFAGDYLDEETILKLAREAGYHTAAIGKLGPALIFDHTERTGGKTTVLDDQSGTPKGIPMAPWVVDGLKAAGLAPVAPGRGANGQSGNSTTPGTTVPDAVQGDWFAAATTEVVLPFFKQDGRPFVLVFWSRDPDGTQHNQGDSLQTLVPGINGPTSLASIRNADDDLARIRTALDKLGLAATTDVIVTADHGFSTISKESATSPAAKTSYRDTAPGKLPGGFLAIDLARALGLPLYDPDDNDKPVGEGAHSKFGNGLIGADPAKPAVVVAANGGSDLVYFPGADRKEMAAKVMPALMAQDYVSGLFVDDALGRFPGTLTLDDIGLKGSAVTPLPAVAVNFTSFATGCEEPELCTVELSDTNLQQGQGMHGTFSRADTHNFMAAVGPDFRHAFRDVAPASNADLGKTIAAIMKLSPVDRGHLVGRVLSEAMPGGGLTPDFVSTTIASQPAPDGLRTVLRQQKVGNTRYFDAAGFPGRTVGLE